MSFDFQQVAALWKAEKRRYVKPSSYSTYVTLINTRLLPFFGPGAPDEKKIQSFVDESLEAGASTKTVRDVLMVLKMILRYGAKIGAWQHPEYEIHFPSEMGRTRQVPVLTKSHQKRLIRYLEDNLTFRGLGILICLYSGLRIGELCGLQWRDLDLATNEIHVRKTVQRIWLNDGDDRYYSLVIGTPKTANSRRDIPLAGELVKLIRPLRRITRDDHYVLTNTKEPIEPRYYRNWFSALLRELGIPPTRFHSLRHTFATRCIESRCDYKTVSVILGHASISTTLDLYVHPGYNEKQRCLEKMAKSIAE